MVDKKFVLLIITVVILSITAVLFSDVLYLFAISGMIAYLLYPIMTFVETKAKIKRFLSIPITLVVVVIIVSLIVITFAPVLTTQIESLIKLIPDYSKTFIEYLNSFDQVLSNIGVEGGLIANIQTLINDNYQSLVKALGTLAGGLMDKIIAVPSFIMNFFFCLMLVVYFLADGLKMIKGFVALFNDKNKIAVDNILTNTHIMVWKYLKMKTLLSAGMAIALWLGFMILGLENAFLFAFIAFLLDFVPYVGALIAAFIPSFVAFIGGGFLHLVLVVVFIIIIQQIQGSILAPKFQADSVGIHPIVGLFALLACSQLWGAIGMFISVPVAGFVQIVCKELRRYYLDIKEIKNV